MDAKVKAAETADDMRHIAAVRARESPVIDAWIATQGRPSPTGALTPALSAAASIE